MKESPDLMAQLRELSVEDTASFAMPEGDLLDRLDTVRRALSRQESLDPDLDYLLIREGARERWTPLTCESVAGSAAEADISLDSRFVSRRHCRFVRTEAGWAVEDLGSKNGVLVNGRRVGPRCDLCTSDAIQLADVTLILVERSEADP
jgi:hypothetical protein